MCISTGTLFLGILMQGWPKLLMADSGLAVGLGHLPHGVIQPRARRRGRYTNWSDTYHAISLPETIMSAKQVAVTLRRHPLAYKTSCVPTHTFVPLERSPPH
jgi:hypothetical protein